MMGNYFSFRNYKLIEFKTDVGFAGISHAVGVFNDDMDDYLFVETVGITGKAILADFNNNSVKAREHIKKLAISRAQARLETGDYKTGERYTEIITGD